MKKNTLIFLHMLSIIINYVIAFSGLFILQKYTLGFIPGLKTIVVLNTFYLYEIVFSILSILVVVKFIKVESPYKKHLC